MRSVTSLYEGLQQKIITALLLVGLVPLVIFGGALYYQYEWSYQEKISEQIKYRTEMQRKTVNLFLNEHRSILGAVADMHTFRQLTDESVLARTLEVLNIRSGGFADLGVIDGDGIQQAYIGPFPLTGLTYTHQPWFAEVMSKGVHISDVFRGYRQRPHFVIAVRRQEGPRTWILRATIDSDSFNRVIHPAQMGETGDAFILNRSGEFQTLPRFSGSDDVLPVDVIEFVRRFGNTITVIEHSGGRLYAGVWLNQPDWLLVLRQDRSEEMSRLATGHRMQFAAIGLAVVLILAFSLFVARQIVRQLAQREAAGNEAKARLTHSDKLAALGKLSVGIAHEINNPLAVISERTGLMGELLEDEPFRESEELTEYQTCIEKIEAQIHRIREVIQNMLTYARKMEPVTENVDVNRLLDQTADQIRRYAGMRNIAVRTELADNLPIIAGSKSHLQQVFFGLLSNAVDAVRKDGRIDVISRMENNHIDVRVMDTGPGIPPHQRGRIFDPFYSTKETGEGMGMGLWTSYNIIRNLGGDLRLESAEGQGSTFTVQIPVVIPEKK